jgi:hypothetical protein
MADKGFGVVYDPNIEVLHRNREGWGEFFRYNRKMGHASASYHTVLRRWWIAPFLRAPLLVYLAPVAILPFITVELLGARWSYLLRFLLLLPACLLGNLVWAHAFRQHVLLARAGRSAPG